MNKNYKKLLKLICCIIVIFILINIFMIPNSNAFTLFNGVIKMGEDYEGPTTSIGATMLKVFIALYEVGGLGYFTIRFTYLGIQYFISVAADEKAAKKEKMLWNLVGCILWFSGMFLMSYLVDL